MIVSPTEPPELREAGKVSMFPETFGADIAIVTKGGIVGIQRKEVGDLLSSLSDGRLGEQLLKMKQCKRAMLLVEGKIAWSGDGEMVQKAYGAPMKIEQWWGIMWSARLSGVDVDFTDGLQKTVEYCRAYEKWLKKEAHGDWMYTRPGPANSWGIAGARDYELMILCMLPGVGPALARRILDGVGMPLRWGITAEQLEGIKGMGPAKVKRIMAAFSS